MTDIFGRKAKRARIEAINRAALAQIELNWEFDKAYQRAQAEEKAKAEAAQAAFSKLLTDIDRMTRARQLEADTLGALSTAQSSDVYRARELVNQIEKLAALVGEEGGRRANGTFTSKPQAKLAQVELERALNTIATRIARREADFDG